MTRNFKLFAGLKCSFSAIAAFSLSLGVSCVLMAGVPARAFEQPVSTAQDLTPLEAFRFGAEAYKSGDKTAAITALEMAAEKGHAVALWKLGHIYADGDGVDINHIRAFSYFHALANARAEDSPYSRHARAISDAFVQLALYYRDGIGDTLAPNLEQSKRLLQHAASYFGDAEAQFYLGHLYLDASTRRQDRRRAARWLNLAAKKDHPGAQALLGQMLIDGDGMRRNAKEGLALLAIARAQASTEDARWIEPMADRAIDAANEKQRAYATARLTEWRIARFGEPPVATSPGVATASASEGGAPVPPLPQGDDPAAALAAVNPAPGLSVDGTAASVAVEVLPLGDLTPQSSAEPLSIEPAGDALDASVDAASQASEALVLTIQDLREVVWGASGVEGEGTAEGALAPLDPVNAVETLPKPETLGTVENGAETAPAPAAVQAAPLGN